MLAFSCFPPMEVRSDSSCKSPAPAMSRWDRRLADLLVQAPRETRLKMAGAIRDPENRMPFRSCSCRSGRRQRPCLDDDQSGFCLQYQRLAASASFLSTALSTDCVDNLVALFARLGGTGRFCQAAFVWRGRYALIIDLAYHFFRVLLAWVFLTAANVVFVQPVAWFGFHG